MHGRRVIKGIITALIAALMLIACGHSSGRRLPSAALRPASINLSDALAQLDAMRTPDGVDETVFMQLKSALRTALKARGQEKFTCTPPTKTVSAVPDLALTDLGDGTMDLTWSYYSVGDNNQDGVVGVADLTPLAIHFGETYDRQSERNSIQAVIDGSASGKVGIEDITQIAMYFGIEVAGYAIETSETPGTGYSQVVLQGHDTGQDAAAQRMHFTYNFTPVAGNWYRVVPCDSAGEPGIPSNEVRAPFPNETAPDAPSGLTATADAATKISLSWTDNSDNEEGFRIERKVGAGGTWSALNTVTANITGYGDEGLTAQTAYYYRLRAYNAKGHSAYSNEANATTPATGTAPNPPMELIAEPVSSAIIQITWDDKSYDEDGFKIERKEESGPWGLLCIRQADTAALTDTAGLSPSTDYSYRVRSYNSAGDSAWSNIASAATFAEGDPPNAPSNLTATTISSSTIELNWQDNSADEAGFCIERKTGMYGAWKLKKKVSVGVTDTSDGTCEGNTTYYYRVRAVGACGYSAYSNEAHATTSGWVHTWGGGGTEEINGIAVDAEGNVIAAGTTDSFGSGDVLILKYSPDGTLLWTKTWDGGDDDAGQGVDTDSDGNIFVSGMAWNGTYMNDTVLLKYAPDGGLTWTRLLTNSSNDKLAVLAVDDAGYIYGGGADDANPFAFKYSTDGDLIWFRGFYGLIGSLNSVCFDGNGNAYLAGYVMFLGETAINDALTVKLDSEGTIAWYKCWGASGGDEAFSAALDGSGNLYVTGGKFKNGTWYQDTFLLKYDSSDGALLSQHVWGGVNADEAFALDVDSSGNVYFAGYSSSFGIDFGTLSVVKVLSTGALGWQELWGDNRNWRQANALCLDDSGNIYIGGRAADSSGFWIAPSLAFTSVSGTDSIPEGVSAIPAGMESGFTGIEATPSGIVDAGGGGSDALVMKIDQSAW